MKILYVIDSLGGGGAEKLIYDMVSRIREHTCEILLLTNKSGKYYTPLIASGIRMYVVPENYKSPIKKLFFIKRIIQDGKYSLIHVNLFPSTYYISIIKKLYPKICPPIVMTEHSTDNRRRHKPYLRPLEKFIYSSFDHVVSISEQTQENLCKWLGTEGDPKFSVIYNGIDIESYKNAKPLPKTELFPAYSEGDILLLIVGSFTTQKNHKIILEALALLPENYKLLLCGEGSLEEKIRKQVKDSGLEDRVVFLGFRNDVARIMHTADILVIPSLWEGFGLIAAEGMACGIPIVASDVPGLSTVIGNSGLLAVSKEPESFIKQIIKLEDYDIYEHYSNLSFENVKKYNIEIMVQKYLEKYYILQKKC